MTSKLTIPFAACLIILGMSNVARALPPHIIQPDEPAAKDAWVYEFFPDDDLLTGQLYGILPAGNSGPNSSHSQQSFLQFNLSSIPLPATRVQSATLGLYMVPTEPTGFPAVSPSAAYNLDVSVYKTNASWLETPLTWNNKPALSATASDTVTLNGSELNNWVSFDVTNLLKDWMNGTSANFGVGVVADEEVRNAEQTAIYAVFESSSNSHKPKISITFTPIPGDANSDDKVIIDDLYALAANWQRMGDAQWSTGDFNGDGNVTQIDLDILAANWQVGAGIAGPVLPSLSFLEAAQLVLPAAVPEPTALSCVCLVGYLALRRTRTRFGNR